MNCPYCNNEMQKGYIPSTSGLARWYENGERRKLLVNNSGIRLSNHSAFEKQVIESYHCKTCRKIIIDVPYAKKRR